MLHYTCLYESIKYCTCFCITAHCHECIALHVNTNVFVSLYTILPIAFCISLMYSAYL